MAINTSYVKFQRGTPTAFNKLATKDKDTLYFISAASATTGSLYLGDILISQECKLNNLNLSEAVENNSILVYNSTTEKWEDKKIADVMAPVMTGATADLAGDSGLVPVPAAGDNVNFLRGDGTWANPVAALEAKVDGFMAVGVQYSTAASLSDVTNPVSGTIYLIPKEDGGANDIYLEYLYTKQGEEEGKFELIGNTGATIESNFINTVNTDIFSVTTNAEEGKDRYLDLVAVPANLITGLDNQIAVEMQTQVGDLTQLFNYTTENPSTLVETINIINERTVWTEMSE